MIILRQREFAVNYRYLFPKINKNLHANVDESISEKVLNSIFSNSDNIIDEIWEYEKDYASKKGLNKNDFKNGLSLYSVSHSLDNTIKLSFEADKNSKLIQIYNPGFYWTLLLSDKTGNILDIEVGD